MKAVARRLRVLIPRPFTETNESDPAVPGVAAGAGLTVVRGLSVTREQAREVVGHERFADLALADARVGPEEPLAVSEAILLVVRDRLELRKVVGRCRGLARSTQLGCVLLEGDEPLLLTRRENWPRLASLSVTRSPRWLTEVQLEEPLDLGPFVSELARSVTPHHLMATGWPVLAVETGSATWWPPGDAAAVIGELPVISDVTPDYPADVVLVAGGAPSRRSGETHRVLGELAPDLHLPAPMSWHDFDEDPGATERLASVGPLALGGADERLLNPVGFVRTPSEPTRRLEPGADPLVCHVHAAQARVDIDTRHGVSEDDIARLRGVDAVELDWRGADGPLGYARLVVDLAMAGIPLTASAPPGWARALLDPALLEAVTDPPTSGDPLEREVRSIRQRRAAHLHHSAAAWRESVGRRVGAQHRSPRSVGVLLATRRPDQIGFALRQAARQRRVDLEVVLAGHGHDPDRRVIDEVVAETGLRVTSLTVPASESLGAVLNQAATRTSADLLLKMDDDDWYGPDFVSDLLLAREYSGADLVGAPPEFVFLEEIGVTVRRKAATERFGAVVAGGTMLLGRDTFATLGGFRQLRRYVDAGLLQALTAAGGSIYRTHGHGYLLRRRTFGHTWDPGLGYFLRRSRVTAQWRGLHPSPLLELTDGPVAGGAA